MIEHHFGWADYGLIGGVCVLFLVIGVIPAFTGGKQSTPVEYLRGNKRLSLLPVALSLSVSYVSGMAMLGLPAEIYFFGIHYILMFVGTALGALLAAYTFLPVMYQTQTSSVNMYLLQRYSSKTVKYAGTLLHTAEIIIMAGVVIVGPSLFIATVSDVPTWASVLLIGAISTVYTSLGGLKAVVWTDALQAAIIYIGILIVLIQGTLKTGSVGRTWQLYSEGGRFNFNFLPNPLKRYDVWVMCLLKFPSWALTYGSNQLAVQRYTSIPSFEKARRCLLLQIPCSFIFAAGYIHNVNQIIPYMVMEVMTLPGLPGLFFAGLLAGGFSNISSSLMAVAQMTWEDLLSDRFVGQKAYVIKTLVFASGVVSTCMAFVLLGVKGTLLQMAFMVSSSIDVPLAVIFIMAVAYPPANSKAVLLSALLASGVITWIAQGALYYKYPPQLLHLTTEHCHGNMTSLNGTMNYMMTNNMSAATVESVQESEDPSWMNVYKISHMWYSPIGYTLGVVVGILLSFIPGFKTKDKIDERYIVPFLRGYFRSYLIQNESVASDDPVKDQKQSDVCESHNL